MIYVLSDKFSYVFGRWRPRGYIVYSREERRKGRKKKEGKRGKEKRRKKEKSEGVKGVLQYPNSFPLQSWYDTNMTMANFLY